jgi:hypothetical protein
VTDSALTLEFLRKDGLSLETPFAWGVMTARLEEPGALLRQLTLARRHANGWFDSYTESFETVWAVARLWAPSREGTAADGQN